MSSFTHLHVASAFSGHYGVTRPEAMVEASVAQGFSALAITDRDGLYGAVKHIGACLQLGIAPIIGNGGIRPTLAFDGASGGAVYGVGPRPKAVNCAAAFGMVTHGGYRASSFGSIGMSPKRY